MNQTHVRSGETNAGGKATVSPLALTRFSKGSIATYQLRLPQYVEEMHLQYSSHLFYAYVMEVQERMDSSIVIQGMSGIHTSKYCPKRDIFLKCSMKRYRLCLSVLVTS